ncbi:synaptonemal complex central element protein 2 [Ictalurus furcatus]|uniref:synaptonemal complex central element protein 2 n=1 Tax=Ictalurus furcatus TaxID=66913 RepID=UPI00234FF4B4|nr:synaptonemal complex central element protein 2 [Ictalurus furcatus]XP_053466661.1 synaptonemal complex central element protein 2 [Ictalurus furcatus]
MAQHFGHPGSAIFQSTPKATHHQVSAKVSEEGHGHGLDQDSTGEILSFVTLDESHEQQSVDSGINVSHRSLPMNEVDESVVSTPINTRIDEIGKKAQDLIERINQNRAMDQKLMNSFEEKLMKKVSEMCQQMKEQMFEYYEKHSREMETKLTELSEVLERSSQLSMELQGASQTLAAINKGLQQTPGQ